MRFLDLVFWAMLSLLLAALTLNSGVRVSASSSQDTKSPKDAEAEAELHKAIARAGNDRAALIRNLKDYLQRFPSSPREGNVYQALVEACQQVRDIACELEYAERLIAAQPDNSDMMMLAVDLLRRRGDDASLTRAAGYVTRVLDRIEKASPAERPVQQSVAQWRDRQQRMRTGLYALRGNVEKEQRDYDAAVEDLQLSYSVHPNAAAAIMLGEIAETRNELPTAISEYALAFVLPEDQDAGIVDRHEVRMKLGNVWRQVHGSEDGLGQEILAAYDRLDARPSAEKEELTAPNRDAKSVFDFVLRRPDGAPLPLAQAKGKIVALSFWATWCSPCRVVEPMFNQVASGYAGNPQVEFLAVDTDQDRTLVPPFLAHEKWNIPIAYADGLDAFLNVQTLPAVLVLDAKGEIIYRSNTFTSQSLSVPLASAINSSLGPSH
ncbi:MAG: TlpA disulfide reductase family protein [Candidatus Acidiferrales bacterium]|jgi:thiol-disulfide isomerase/thioredoxin